jgi:anti-repressor protein
MNELIKIEENEQGQSVVSARNLYHFLGVTERFSRFMERNFEFGFEENEDYTPYQMVHPLNNQEIQDYALTLDCAKEISMLQRNAKGKEARKYFIEAEKQLRQLQLHSYQIEDPIERAKKWIEEQQEKQLLEQNNLLLQANNQDLQIELDEHEAWYSVKRVCLLGHFKSSQAKTLWRKLKTYSIVNNYKIVSIFDANYGSVKTYHKDVWKAVYQINL